MRPRSPALYIATAVLVLAYGFAAAEHTPAGLDAPSPRRARPLRRLPSRRRVHVGAAVAYAPLVDDPVYASVLRREFDIVTPENAMKWETIHPAPDRYDFSEADRIVTFARRRGMRVRGHTLVWHAQNPPWLEGRLTSPSVATAILEDHIARVVGHFRGAVHEWDVVNEVVGPVDGSLRDTPWLRAIGPGYIELAFRLAHEADPAAKLYLNDFLLERSGPKLDGVVALVADLKANGAPIDGVGVQAHAACLSDCGGWFDELATSLRRIADLGVDVAITELDVGIPLPSTPNELRGQAQIYASAVDACLAVPRCRTIVMWGFTDRYSWVPSEFPGLGDALPFDDLYRPKPAYWALNEHLRMRGARRRRLATPLSAPAAPPARDAADAGSSPRATPCGASP